MKKIVLIYPFIFALLFTSCLFNEEEIFDSAPSVRVEQINEECKAALVAAPQGWVMEYYPNTENYGSYLIHMFFTNENVTMTSSTNLSVSEKSLYSLKESNSGELSFDTYNPILHMYSDPQDDGVGYGGDFEFMIVSVTDDLITLQGSKTGTRVYMQRLADDMTFSDYLGEISAVSSRMFDTNIALQPDWLLIHGEDTVYVRRGVNNTFKVSEDPNFPVVDTDNMAGAVLFDGLRINPGISMDNKQLSMFILEEGDNCLVADGNMDYVIAGGDFADFFSKTYNAAYIFPESKPATVEAALQTLSSQLAANFSSHQIQSVGLSYTRDLGHVVIVNIMSGSSLITAQYGVNVTFDAKDKQFTISSLPTPAVNNNITNYMNRGVTAWEDLANSVLGTYSYENVTPLTLNQVRIFNADASVDLTCTKALLR